jgi:ribosome-associated protein
MVKQHTAHSAARSHRAGGMQRASDCVGGGEQQRAWQRSNILDDLTVSSRLTIPANALEVQYARSGGPGGQNVNKLNTKVTLRWNLRDNPQIPQPWKRRVLSKHANRVNNDGEIVLHSERHRVQKRNLEDCRQKLKQMLLECQHPPTPRKRTKPTLASKRRRLEAKRRQSDKKRLRKRPRVD